MFESLDESILESEDILKIKKLLENTNKRSSNNLDKKLIEEINLNPENLELRLKLADNYLSSNEAKKGFDELLKIFEKNPKWNDEVAKKKLLEFFDLLGFNDPNVIEARKKLSTLMFK